MTEIKGDTVTLENNKDDDPTSDSDKNGTDKNGSDKNGDYVDCGKRPMNAFLIFCKKHRSVVKKSYPNSENRVITKMLGDWWANLDFVNKKCYKDLAKQNKDALYNANPDFQWYKSKSCSTRPSKHNTSNVYPDDYSNSSHDSYDTKLKNNNHIIKPIYVIQPSSSKINYEVNKPIFTPGKLADIAQMGSLNSLMNCNGKTDDAVEKPFNEEETAQHTRLSDKTVPLPPFKKRRFCESSYSDEGPEKIETVQQEIDCKKFKVEKENANDKLQQLQYELLETSRHFKNLNSLSENSSIDDFQCKNVSSKQCYEKEELFNDCDDSNQKSVTKSSHHVFDNDLDETNNNFHCTRNGRSCKGKRYEEFMYSGCLLTNKRTKKNHFEKKVNSFKHADDHSTTNGDRKEKHQKNECIALYNGENKNSPKSAYNRSDKTVDSDDIKPFIPYEFDLESKIRDLPFLNFREFMQKKKEDKKNKSKIKPKSKIFLHNTTEYIDADLKEPIESNYNFDREQRLNLAAEYKNSIKGSKKRKPKKNSITRRKVDSQKFNDNPENEIPIFFHTNTVEPTSTPITIDQIPTDSRQLDTSALVTLAEVASRAPTLIYPLV